MTFFPHYLNNLAAENQLQSPEHHLQAAFHLKVMLFSLSNSVKTDSCLLFPQHSMKLLMDENGTRPKLSWVAAVLTLLRLHGLFFFFF